MAIVLSLTKKQHEYLKELLTFVNPKTEELYAIQAKLNKTPKSAFDLDVIATAIFDSMLGTAAPANSGSEPTGGSASASESAGPDSTVTLGFE